MGAARSPWPAVAVVAAIVLAGCARLPVMPWQDEDDIVQLEDFDGCTLPAGDGDPADCSNPLTPRPTRPRVGDAWVCVGGRPGSGGPMDFRIHRHNASGRIGLSYTIDEPADRYTGWFRVRDRDDEAVYNATSEHDDGFVVFPDVETPAGERLSVEAQLAAVTYTSRTGPLGDAAKHPTWIPVHHAPPNETGFDWWLVHAFETGDTTYTVTRGEPQNIRIAGRGIHIIVQLSSWRIDWEGNVLAPSEDC